MSSSWPTVKLGDYCKKIGSGATPRGGASVYMDDGEICLIRSQNIYNEGFNPNGLVYIDEVAAKKLKNVTVEENDVLLNITGDSVARVCLAKSNFLPARVNQHVAIIRPSEKEFDSRFIRYLLASPAYQNILLSIAAVGATRNALTKEMIENLDVVKPPIEQQIEIADKLEALEKKIDINSETNQTLEQIAQALFKSWFVDFDPVKAKIAVLEAGLPAPCEGAFYTYALECDDGSYYIGQTDDLKRRWHEHLAGKAAQWTKAHKPICVAHFEKSSSREEAVSKEKDWKTTSGRREIKKLIASGAARQAGGTAAEAELAAMGIIAAKSPKQLAQLKQSKPEAYEQLAQTAALFPSAMQKSELGDIPEGWETPAVQDVATTLKGKSYKSAELELSSTALVTLKSFNRGGGYRLDGLKEYTGKYKPEQEVFAGDLIIANTDVTQAADVIGKPAMVISNARYEHLVISLDVAVVRPLNDNLKYYLYGMAKTDEFQQHTQAHSTGTTVLHLSKKAVPDYRFVLAKKNLVNAYVKQAMPIFSKINQIIEENNSLTMLRDTLLPRLLSGDLPITNNRGFLNE